MTGSIATGADDRSAAAIPRLHPGHLTDPVVIRDLLSVLQREQTPLTRGMNRRIEVETSLIEAVGRQSLTVRTTNFEPDSRSILFLNFVLRSEPYFFQAQVLHRLSDSKIEIEIPTILYRRERRSRERAVPEFGLSRISLEYHDKATDDLPVVDSSPEGIAIDVPTELAQRLGTNAKVSVLPARAQSRLYGVVRNVRPGPRPGWTRLGLEVDAAPSADLRCESLQDLSPGAAPRRLEQSLRIVLGGAQLAFDRAIRRIGRDLTLPKPNVVDIHDAEGRRIRALVNSWGPLDSTTAVVIPPAWGRTKETLMPLAATVVECFRRSGRPISVLRFDGINKRGESFRDAGCSAPGCEHHRFTFSQGVRDIRTVIDHLHADSSTRPRSTILVSFSASSIEARRAVVEDPRIDGWVCVVGSADLQSMMRSISGGIDYALGLERGIEFGLQEILGVEVDMDLAGSDALAHRLAYLSDARREMSRIRVPVVWIRGRYDAWMDAERVCDAMSRGDTSLRKLIEIPTGHMLKSSLQALGVFQLVAREVGQIASAGEPGVYPGTPNLAELERWRMAELQRISTPDVDLRRFWSNYLLGKDRTIGFELFMLTSAYRAFMCRQMERLGLKDGDRVIDLGSGAGGFPFYLGEAAWPNGLAVIEVDFVRDGLRRARSRLGEELRVEYVEADVEADERGASLPIASSSADAVLASLLLSYVKDPGAVLREIRRVLRPGGRVVLSSLRRDADMSKLLIEGAADLRERWNGELAKWGGGIALDDAVRGYMNEASRLLDLEEHGRFQFWDPVELASLLDSESFVDVQIDELLGDPPQAGIASAVRPHF